MSNRTLQDSPTETLFRLRDQVASVIRGRPEALERLLICLLAEGHALLEDVPGTGKTTLAYSLSRSLDLPFRRIQFTSDLLPSDVLGVSVYHERDHEFVFQQGPVFTSILLADEINRAMPKTQSSLLEVMDRGKVSMDGKTYALEPPFLVVATQNPVDYESTFPLPASQLDRFLMRFSLGFPGLESEREILESPNQKYDELELSPVADRLTVRAWQQAVRNIFVEESVLEYLLRIGRETRERSVLHYGASTRALLGWKRAAQARAFLQKRNFVSPADVTATCEPVLAHRLSPQEPILRPEEADRLVREELRDIVDAIPAPV